MENGGCGTNSKTKLVAEGFFWPKRKVFEAALWIVRLCRAGLPQACPSTYLLIPAPSAAFNMSAADVAYYEKIDDFDELKEYLNMEDVAATIR